ncbi:MAG TPA: hypothetical protein VF066_14170 [Thermoleophilaceae bacterium]
MAKASSMKVTTVRFSEDLWAAVAAEAALAGVSASEFIREAALARAAAAAGARGEFLFNSYSSAVKEVYRGPSLPADRQRELHEALSMLSRALAGTARSDAEALRAESRQARGVAKARAARAREERARRST